MSKKNGSEEGVKEESLQMEFTDNALLPMLFGDQDANLARIENKLSISAASRRCTG